MSSLHNSGEWASSEGKVDVGGGETISVGGTLRQKNIGSNAQLEGYSGVSEDSSSVVTGENAV